MTSARKLMIDEQLETFLELLEEASAQAAAEELAERVHEQYSKLSLDECIRRLKARGINIQDIRRRVKIGSCAPSLVPKRSAAIMTLPLAASAAPVEADSEESPIAEFGSPIWISGEPFQLYIDRKTRALLLKIDTSAGHRAVILGDRRFELRPSEAPGVSEVRGLLYDQAVRVLDVHDKPEKAGRFE